MSGLRRIVLIRHGETVGNSASACTAARTSRSRRQGLAQMRRAAAALRTEVFDLVVASTLRRSWEAAQLIAGGAPIRLENDFREIHFGRWEGLTQERDRGLRSGRLPELAGEGAGLRVPGRRAARAVPGPRRARSRAPRRRAAQTPCSAVLHRGVIRTIGEQLLGSPLEDVTPSLGEVVSFSRNPGGGWFCGRRSSNPEALPPVPVSA